MNDFFEKNNGKNYFVRISSRSCKDAAYNFYDNPKGKDHLVKYSTKVLRESGITKESL